MFAETEAVLVCYSLTSIRRRFQAFYAVCIKLGITIKIPNDYRGFQYF